MNERAGLSGGATSVTKLPSSLVLGIFFLVFFFVYGSVLFVDYAYFEDYFLLDEATINSGDITRLTWGVVKRIQEGRPLYALATKLFLYLADDIQDLRYVRFMGIVGISLLGWGIYYMLMRTGRGAFQSFCAGVIICSSLPIQLYAGWATTSIFTFAAFASGVAVYLADRAFSDTALVKQCLLVSGATTALLAALTIYQPAAMFFWVFAAITLLAQDSSFREVNRRFTLYLMICMVAMLLGYSAYKAGGILFPYLPVNTPRGELVQSVLPKIWSFLHVLLPSAVNVSVFQAYGRGFLVSVYVILTVIAVGIFMYFNGALNLRILKFSMASAMLIFSFTPLLVVAESGYPLQGLSAFTGLVLLLAVFAFHGYARVFRIQGCANVVTGCAAIGCAMFAAYQMLAHIVMPQARELTIMQSQLAADDFSHKKNIHVILPDPEHRLSQRFPLPNSSSHRIAGTMVRLLQRDMAPVLGAEFSELPVTWGTVHDPVPPSSLVVDMHKVLGTLSRVQSNAVRSDDLRVYGPGVDRREKDFIKKWFAPDGQPELSGRPIIRSRFDVHLRGNPPRTLRYFRHDCTRNDTDVRFFLHLFPVYEKDIPDTQMDSGFVNRDFDFKDYGVIHDGICMVKIRLPSYPLQSLRTGQYIIGQGRIWDEEFHFPARVH